MGCFAVTGPPETGATSAPSSNSSGSPPKRRRRPVVWAVVVPVVVTAAALAGTYWGELTMFVALTPWSSAGPKGTVSGFLEHLQAGDDEGMKAMVDGGFDAQRGEDGVIQALRVGGMPSMLPTSVAELTPSVPMEQAEVTYSYHRYRGGVTVSVPNQAGGTAVYQLTRVGGTWRIRGALSRRGPGG